MATGKEKAGVTVVLTALIIGGVALPAESAPAPGSKITAVPDAGLRPQAASIPLLPSGRLATPPVLPAAPIDFLNAQLEAATAETQVLAERINELQIMHEQARLTLAWADHAWRQADETLLIAKENAAKAAVDAYRSGAQLPGPFQGDSIIRDLHQLNPGRPHAPAGGQDAAYDLERAQAEEKLARDELLRATDAEKAAQAEVTVTIATLKQRDSARLVLQERLEALRTEEELRLEREEAKLRLDYSVGQSNKGLVAHEDAQAVVRFALDQLGKPYRFAEEGPSMFDCSGLTWRGYLNTGLRLPRVSKDQYFAFRTKPVELDALLPGDLLFYARDPGDWRTIHHVMIYLGVDNGVHKIVHAPRSGDVVKISKIYLGPGSPVDFAVRIIDAVPVTPPAEEPDAPEEESEEQPETVTATTSES